MANDDVFLQLANKLEKEFANEVKDALITATKKAVNEEGRKMEINLKRGAGVDSRLAKNQITLPIIDTDNYYSYQIDWKDSIVDADIGVNYGVYPDKERMAGKRNFSRAPATWHDLAYIIDNGRVANFSKTGVKVIAGTNFIKKARRNAKKWVKKRDIYATAALQIVANNLDKG